MVTTRLHSLATSVHNGIWPAYYLIAGVNAPQAIKDVANAVCDGTADQVEINAALAVDDKRPIMLVGRFTTSAAITFADGIKHDLIGFNEDYAEIQANHTGNALELHSIQLPQEWRITIANLKITKGSGFVPARGISIQNAAFTTFRNVAVRNIDTGAAVRGYFSNSNVFENCTFSDSAIGVELTGVANQASHLNTFSSCFFRANDIGLKITDRAHGNSWTACSFDYGGASDIAVQMAAASNETNGQTWKFCWFEGGNSSGALDLQGGSDLIFDRCRFAPTTTSWPIVKVSGFAATGVAIIDPIVSNPATFDTLPSAVSVITSDGISVDVTAFGAKGDGVTDDRPAMQRAIDHLGTVGGTVTGPPGTYLVSRAGVSDGLNQIGYCLRARVDSVHGPLTFDFPRGTMFKLANSQAAKSVILLVDGTLANRRLSPTIVRGITFEGNYTSQSAWDDFGLFTAIYSNDIIVEQCTFQNYYYAGVHVLRDCRGVRIRDNVFDGTAFPVGSTGPNVRIEIQDLVFEGNRLTTDAVNGRPHMAIGDNADIQLQGTAMRILNNTFAGGYGGYGVDLGGVSHCIVMGNLFRDVCNNAGCAFRIAEYINGNGTVYDGQFNIIQNNTFFNVRFGIQLSGSGSVMTANAVTANYSVGAVGNIVANNVITSDPVALRSVIGGGGDTYPDRFSPAPNATAINMSAGIRIQGQDKSSGTATGASTTTTLVSAAGGMTANAYQNWQLVITGGTGKGQVRRISSHTSTTFTVASAWDVIPDATSTYRVTNKVGFNKVTGNIIHCTNNTTKAIEDTSWLPGEITDNTAYNSNTGATVFAAGTSVNNPNALMRGNKAYANAINGAETNQHLVYQDENSGVASITSAATSVTVTHKLGRTPTQEQIVLTPGPMGSSKAIWVTNITPTTFDIAVDVAPGATLTVGWRVFGTP